MHSKTIDEHLMLDYTKVHVDLLSLYISEDDFIYIAFSDAQNNSCVTCVELAFGKEIWKTKIDSNVTSKLVVSDDRLIYGTTILDRESGKCIVDLNHDLLEIMKRELSYEYVYFYQNQFQIYVDKKSEITNYLSLDIDSKITRNISTGFFINPAYSEGERVYSASNGKVVCYDLDSSVYIWCAEMNIKSDKFTRIKFFGENVYVKCWTKIYELNRDTGYILNEYDLEKAGSSIGDEFLSIGSTYFDVDDRYIYFGKIEFDPKRNKSWVCVLDRSTFRPVIVSQHAIKGAISFFNGKIHTINEDDYPLFLSVEDLEFIWRGKTKISSRHILVNRNYVVYFFSGGGFQIYKTIAKQA